MNVMRVCRKPAISVSPGDSVRKALETMTEQRVGAVVVTDNDKAVGVFTRLDAIERVVLKALDLDATQVSAVMTSPVEVLSSDSELPEAMRFLASRKFNHVPIVDADSKVVGLATTKPVMKQTIEKLSDEIGSLEAFFTADGIGG